MYTLISKFVSSNEKEMCHDHWAMSEYASDLGCLSAETFFDQKNNCYIQIQSWPSKKYYDALFDLSKWDFTSEAKELISEELVELMQRMKSHYKMHVLHELENIL